MDCDGLGTLGGGSQVGERSGEEDADGKEERSRSAGRLGWPCWIGRGSREGRGTGDVVGGGAGEKGVRHVGFEIGCCGMRDYSSGTRLRLGD